MTTERSRLTDHDIERFLRARSKEPDAALWSDIMAAAGSSSQRAGVWARWGARRQVFAIVLTALLVVVMAGAVGMAVGLIRPVPPVPSPEVDRSLVAEALNFDRPFSYAIPAGSGLVLDSASPAVHRFEGIDRGVAVIAIRPGTGTFSCSPGRGGSGTVVTGTAPEVLNNLRVIGGMGIGVESPGTLDSRPALTADIDPGRHACEHPELLIPGTQAITGHVSLEKAARLVLADIDGLIVAVQIWTERPEDLEAWIPTATEFVKTIHFFGASLEFAVPFDHANPSDSGLTLEMATRRQYRFEAPTRGIVMFALGPDAYAHYCEAREAATGTPEQVLESLRRLTGGVGASAPMTLTSYPALATDINATSCLDIHVRQGPSLEENYVKFHEPSRLILADVQGVLVGVQIWAGQPDELEAWLPTAMEFVESIEFSNE